MFFQSNQHSSFQIANKDILALSVKDRFIRIGEMLIRLKAVGYQDDMFLWEKIASLLNSNISVYDYNMVKSMHSYQDFLAEYADFSIALQNIGSWRSVTCSICKAQTAYTAQEYFAFIKANKRLPYTCKDANRICQHKSNKYLMSA